MLSAIRHRAVGGSMKATGLFVVSLTLIAVSPATAEERSPRSSIFALSRNPRLVVPSQSPSTFRQFLSAPTARSYDCSKKKAVLVGAGVGAVVGAVYGVTQ